jgi:hypothetical protein
MASTGTCAISSLANAYTRTSRAVAGSIPIVVVALAAVAGQLIA